MLWSSCPPLFTECGRSRSCNHRDPSATPPTLQTTHAYHDHAASAAATADGIARLKKQIGKLLSKTGSEFRRFDVVKITSKSMNNNAAERERALLLRFCPFCLLGKVKVAVSIRVSGINTRHALLFPSPRVRLLTPASNYPVF